jgi:hypothetical protein
MLDGATTQLPCCALLCTGIGMYYGHCLGSDIVVSYHSMTAMELRRSFLSVTKGRSKVLAAICYSNDVVCTIVLNMLIVCWRVRGS